MLSDLICKVPGLLCYLAKADSLQNVLATSSALHQQVHQHVTKAIVGQQQPQQDLAILIKGHWPRLVHVRSCRNAPKCWAEMPEVVSLLAQPTQLHNQLQCIDFSSSQMASRSVAVLLAAPFGQLMSLQLRDCKLDNECARALSLSQLPSLQALNLTDNSLGADAMAHICNANWPHLRKLRLGQNPICNVGVRHLATASWPLLEKLHLEKARWDGNALPFLCQGNWPCLQRLGLNYNNLYDCPNLQVDAAWSSLKEARLGQCGCGHSTLLQLPRLLLHDIEVVDLMDSFMDTAGVQLLVQADWPKLIALRLDGYGIDEAGMHELVKADWPRLERLYLSHINLYPEVVRVLSKGCWPKLRKLDICQGRYKLRGVNNIEGIKSLVQAQWPSLEWLCLYKVFEDAPGMGVFRLFNSRWPGVTLHVESTVHSFAC